MYSALLTSYPVIRLVVGSVMWCVIVVPVIVHCVDVACWLALVAVVIIVPHHCYCKL